jgi:ATP-binding cassette subfamily C (CFTR/MRP) protein 4
LPIQTGIIDEILPSTSYDAIGIICTDIGIMVMLALVNPWLLVPFVALAIMILFIRQIYVRTARQIKMLEGVARSPVFSQLSASLHGLATIRAFNAQKRFEHRFDLLQNDHTSGWFFYVTTARWFLFWMDMTSVVFVAGITAVTLLFVDSSNGSLVGLIISSTLLFSSGFQWYETEPCSPFLFHD